MRKTMLAGMVVFLATLAAVSLMAEAAENAGGKKGGAAVGVVLAVKGAVTAEKKGGKSRTLALTSKVYSGDVIKTGKRGRIQIIFNDDTTMSIGRNATMKIEKYRYDQKGNDGVAEMSVSKGSFRLVSGQIAKMGKDRIKVNTPTATAGVRGTMGVGEVGPKKGLVIVFVGGKSIRVSNKKGAVELTKPKQGTKVLPNAAPQPAMMFSKDFLTALMNRTAVRGNPKTKAGVAGDVDKMAEELGPTPKPGPGKQGMSKGPSVGDALEKAASDAAGKAKESSQDVLEKATEKIIEEQTPPPYEPPPPPQPE